MNNSKIDTNALQNLEAHLCNTIPEARFVATPGRPQPQPDCYFALVADVFYEREKSPQRQVTKMYTCRNPLHTERR